MTQLKNNLNDIKNNNNFCIIDLETTGLDPKNDCIIEIGIIVYVDSIVTKSFRSYINSHKPIPSIVSEITGITDADLTGSPEFMSVSNTIMELISDNTIVGHNIKFDLEFLKKYGLLLNNRTIDTLDLSYVAFPMSTDYSLAGLATYLKIDSAISHRALDDCKTTLELLLKCINTLWNLKTTTLAQIHRLSQTAKWESEYLINDLLINKLDSIEDDEFTGKDLNTDIDQPIVQLKKVDEIFNDHKILGVHIPDYEYRNEQLTMAVKVLDAFQHSYKLMVEAGTGVGKSIAYLIPAIWHSIHENEKVVISTNTISLQEQLIGKDIPLARRIIGAGSTEDISFALLKGRSNYICLPKFYQLLQKETADYSTTLLLGKFLVWFDHTKTGDISEVNISRSEHLKLIPRLNAENSLQCNGYQGHCYLRNARNNASEANVIVVNHSLLMADLKSGGSVLPDYDNLIVDEAHQIEDQASSAFGFNISKFIVLDYLDNLSGSDSLVSRYKSKISVLLNSNENMDFDNKIEYIKDLSQKIQVFFSSIFNNLFTVGDSFENKIRITDDNSGKILQNDIIKPLYENSIVGLSDLLNSLISIQKIMESKVNDSDIIELIGETEFYLSQLNQLRDELTEFIEFRNNKTVYWIQKDFVRESASLCSSPFEVGELLDEMLFSKKKTVVMTSATLATDNSFDHISNRTGFLSDESLLLGSPFDYKTSSMMIIPNDMPDPRNAQYNSAVAESIYLAAKNTEGGTMALFTSHASLKATLGIINEKYRDLVGNLYAQGINGTPRTLLKKMRNNPNSLLLGTSTFWEGIDLRGDLLKTLIITKLPFSVPSDPVYQARFSTYENGFTQYAVPNAIIRFRQGFGRLIRSSNDKGVVIVLDSRIYKSGYGKRFIHSLPEMKISRGVITDIPDMLSHWWN
jgi:DNA polymerase-3 subunit epsilon/ATP-dependent DNA helicase DinG